MKTKSLFLTILCSFLLLVACVSIDTPSSLDYTDSSALPYVDDQSQTYVEGALEGNQDDFGLKGRYTLLNTATDGEHPEAYGNLLEFPDSVVVSSHMPNQQWNVEQFEIGSGKSIYLIKASDYSDKGNLYEIAYAQNKDGYDYCLLFEKGILYCSSSKQKDEFFESLPPDVALQAYHTNSSMTPYQRNKEDYIWAGKDGIMLTSLTGTVDAPSLTYFFKTYDCQQFIQVEVNSQDYSDFKAFLCSVDKLDDRSNMVLSSDGANGIYIPNISKNYFTVTSENAELFWLALVPYADDPPCFGTGEADPSSMPSSTSTNIDFYKKYPDGNFIIRVVDSQNVPLINAQIVANLNCQEYQEMYRGTVTNSDGEGKLDVPHDSESEFISGEYEFKVIQYLPDGSSREEIIRETLTEDNTYPVFNLTPMSWTADTELYKNYEDKVVIELIKDGKPVKNTWTVLKPTGVSTPDIGGTVPKLGKSEGYTDTDGKIYFYNVPYGSYTASFHAENMYQLGYFAIEVDGAKTQEFSFAITK